MKTVTAMKRRRYGKQWFCWVYVWVDGGWVSLGDPWPKVTPSKHEINEAIKALRGDKSE